MADEERTFTQEEVNKLVGQARLEGKEIGRKEFEGFISPEDAKKQTESLAEQLKTLTDEKTALETQLTESKSKIAGYEIDSVKTKVARELGLPYDAMEFLKGEDEEAIRRSGESMKILIGTKAAPPLGNPEAPPEEDGVTAAFYKLNPNLRKK